MYTNIHKATSTSMISTRGRRRGPAYIGRARRAELLREQAISANSPEEKLAISYRGAREKGALLLGAPPRRGPNNVWLRLERECPAVAEWARTFRGYSDLVSAIDAGLPRSVDDEFARQFLWAVGQFFERVESELSQENAAA